MSRHNSEHHNDANQDAYWEAVDGKDNVVKITSYEDGSKKEVYVWAFSEEQFDKLLPENEREHSYSQKK